MSGGRAEPRGGSIPCRGRGFKEVYNLKGGIKAWQGVKAVGPVELNLDLIRGDESPGELIVLAYGMEEALRRFYSSFGQRQPEGRLKDLFRLLAAAEEKHQELLKKAYQELAPSPGGAEPLYFSRLFAGPGGRVSSLMNSSGKTNRA